MEYLFFLVRNFSNLPAEFFRPQFRRKISPSFLFVFRLSVDRENKYKKKVSSDAHSFAAENCVIQFFKARNLIKPFTIPRALMFTEKNFDYVVPAMAPREEDLTFLALVQRELTLYIAALEQAKLREGLRYTLAISKHGNQYMQAQQPWVKVKGSDEDK